MSSPRMSSTDFADEESEGSVSPAREGLFLRPTDMVHGRAGGSALIVPR